MLAKIIKKTYPLYGSGHVRYVKILNKPGFCEFVNKIRFRKTI